MTNLLHKYSKRKDGWRVKFLFTKDDKVIQNSVYVINNTSAEYLVTVDEGTPEDKVPHHLENKVVKLINKLENRDRELVTRESLMFGILAKTLRAQSQFFVGFVSKEEKQKLNDFNRRCDRMANTLTKPYQKLIGKEQLEALEGDMGEAIYRVYDAFRYSIETGKQNDFMKMIESYLPKKEKSE
jgi:ssRNA-specific RNase YbeY (16S rRNA maturation enzyme)